MGHLVVFLRGWTFDPLPAGSLLLTATAYLAATRSVGRRSPSAHWPRARTTAFVSGLALAWVVILGPVGTFDDTFFWCHMVQHMTLMMVVAPLLLLGAPVLLFLQVSTPTFRRRRIVPVLRSRALAAVTHPVFTWLLFAGVLVGTHFSPFYQYALTHPLIHRLVEHPLYLGTALLYFYPLVGANPGPRRLAPAAKVLSLLTMMGPETMTGFFLFSATYPLYPAYASAVRPFGPAPMPDQQFGGALMWGGSMVIDALWIVVAMRQWFFFEQQKARRSDAQLAAEMRGRP